MNFDRAEEEDYLRRKIQTHSRRLYKMATLERERRVEFPSVILSHEAIQVMKRVNDLLVLRESRLRDEVQQLRKPPGDPKGD
jgi:hypothetical protein